MANFKRTLTDAARRRIEARIAETLKTEDARDRLRADQILSAALQPENFRHDDNVAEQLVQAWIRDEDVPRYLRWMASEVYYLTARKNANYQSAARDLMSGLRQLGALQR